jgi:hypothetical protein
MLHGRSSLAVPPARPTSRSREYRRSRRSSLKEFDLYTAPLFRERVVELIESGKTHILVDLRHGTFLDPSNPRGMLMQHLGFRGVPNRRRWSSR